MSSDLLIIIVDDGDEPEEDEPDTPIGEWTHNEFSDIFYLLFTINNYMFLIMFFLESILD